MSIWSQESKTYTGQINLQTEIKFGKVFCHVPDYDYHFRIFSYKYAFYCQFPWLPRSSWCQVPVLDQIFFQLLYQTDIADQFHKISDSYHKVKFCLKIMHVF